LSGASLEKVVNIEVAPAPIFFALRASRESRGSRNNWRRARLDPHSTVEHDTSQPPRLKTERRLQRAGQRASTKLESPRCVQNCEARLSKFALPNLTRFVIPTAG